MGNRQEFINYQQAVKTGVKAQFPSLNGLSIDVRVFEKFSLTELTKPAIVFGLPILDKSPLKTDDEFWVRPNNSAYVITSNATDVYGLDAQQLALNLANFIDGNDWNNTANCALFDAITPDSIQGLNNCTIIRVDFNQDLQIIDKN